MHRGNNSNSTCHSPWQRRSPYKRLRPPRRCIWCLVRAWVGLGLQVLLQQFLDRGLQAHMWE